MASLRFQYGCCFGGKSSEFNAFQRPHVNTQQAHTGLLIAGGPPARDLRCQLRNQPETPENMWMLSDVDDLSDLKDLDDHDESHES